MSTLTLGAIPLRVRLALLCSNSLTIAAVVLFLSLLCTFIWMQFAVRALERSRDEWQEQVRRTLTANSDARAQIAAFVAPKVTPDNLSQFYAALGQRRYADQQVKILFGLAAKNGLTLVQGEYKGTYDRNALVYTYQVNLPIKGSYVAIWTFAMGVLRAIPFASLDDISFRRTTIGDPQVEATMRLTFYLTDESQVAWHHLADRAAGVFE